MIYPQQHLQLFLNQNNNNSHRNYRNTICVELTDCSTDESSTDDYQLIKSSNCYWTKSIPPAMDNIDEHEILSSPIIEESNINHNNEEVKGKSECELCYCQLCYHPLFKLIIRQFVSFLSFLFSIIIITQRQ